MPEADYTPAYQKSVEISEEKYHKNILKVKVADQEVFIRSNKQ